MAKDNFLLYATRGAVGNVVVRRDGGQTVVSARPTSVTNPRTFAQAEVRMRLAAVSRFYSPLSGVLAQSWQNKTTRESQSEFSSRNIELMKANRYGWPKSADFGPMPFQVSKGSIASAGAWLESGTSTKTLGVFAGVRLSEDYADSIGWLSRQIKRAAGLEVDKFQMTVIVCDSREENLKVTYFPRFTRIFCDTASTASLSAALPGWMSPFSSAVAGDEDLLLFSVPTSCVGVAVIISYFDRFKKVWVRSTEYLWSDPDFVAALSLPGTYENCVYTFMNSAEVSDPEGRVYLDGETTRSGGSSGGDSGYDYDPSSFVPTVNDAALSARPVSVSSASFDGHTVVTVVMDDGSAYPITGCSRLIRFYGSVLGVNGTKYALSDSTTLRPQCVEFTDTDNPDGNYINAYAWVAEAAGLPASSVLA